MARKWAAILGVFVLVLGIFGMQVLFVIRQINVKQIARAEVQETPESQLTRFTFTQDEFNKLTRPENNDKEFVIDGKYYDTKSIKRSGNNVVVYAKYDHDEHALVIKFVKEFEKEFGDKGEGKKKRSPVKMVIHEYTKSPQNVQLTVPDNTIINLHYSASELVSVDINVQTPPPDTSKHILSYNGSV
jgi:hypothetical protein